MSAIASQKASVAERVTPSPLPRGAEYYSGADQFRALAAVEATWSLLDLGLSAFNRKIAENAAQSQNHVWQHDAKRLSTDIVRAFWRLNAHQNHHETIQNLSKQVEQALIDAERDANNPKKADQKAGNLYFMREVTDLYRYLLALERNIADAPAVMNNLLDLPQSTALKIIAQPMDLPFTQQSPEQWVEKALAYSPELNAAQRMLDLHDVQTKRDIVALLPSVTAIWVSNSTQIAFC